MRLTQIAVTDFRSYSKRSFEFYPDITLIVGPNGSGKTNILEAMYLLATGKSWRTASVADTIGFPQNVAHVSGLVEMSPGEDISLQVILTRGMILGKRTPSIQFRVDQVAKRRADFIGRLAVVLFEPESLEIVIGDPSFRRQYLDEALSQTDKEYFRSLLSYTKALRIRNKLLDAIRDGRTREETLEFWERTLAKHGELIQNCRQGFIEWIGDNSYKNYKDQQLKLTYLPNVITKDRLDQYRDREILAGYTFVGPQRDDFVIAKIAKLNENRESRNLAQFGSRGEQRMAVLQLKLLEAKWIKEKTGETPVILLDDIFSELDSEHEKMVGELVAGRQTIMTATEVHRGHYPEARVVELS